MVTPISSGLTLIENNADTQIWTNPGTIDLDNFVFGESYMFLQLLQAIPNPSNNISFESFPGGSGFATPLGEWQETIPIEGKLEHVRNNWTGRNDIIKFFGLHRKVSQPLLYAIIKEGTDYCQFFDPTDIMRTYAPGYLSAIQVEKNAKDCTFGTVKGIFQIVWGAV